MRKIKFDRMELAGSLGDLGTLLPIAIGLITINGLDPLGLFLVVGLYYILSGLYFRVTMPVQPMKVIGAYAIATGIAAPQLVAASFWVFLFLLIIGATGVITLLGRITPRSVVRGVQLSTGLLLMAQGVKFIIGTSKLQVLQQAAEPYLAIQALGPIPLGLIIGVLGGVLALLFLENRRFPAGLLIVLAGLLVGLLLGKSGTLSKVSLGFHLPGLFPLGLPSRVDLGLALLILVLPQLPMTLGNAVIANEDLSRQYFGDDARRVTCRSLCISMALANLGSFLLGGMPLCHGAGGLAAQYRFGARTAGANLMIGLLLALLALFLGPQGLPLLNLMPMSLLGVLLVFAGGQLALTLMDVKQRKDLFVVLLIVGITMASNLAAGYVVGVVAGHALKSESLNI